MSQIFLIIDRKQEGPFSDEEVRGKLAAGVIDGETFARLDEGSEWFPLSKFLDTSAFPPVKKQTGPPAIPPFVWVIAIFYFIYYPAMVVNGVRLMIRFSGAGLFSLFFMVFLLVVTLKIVAGILLLRLSRIALLLMIVAFVIDLGRVALQLSTLGWQKTFGLHPWVIGTWVLQVAILIYTGSLVKNRTLR